MSQNSIRILIADDNESFTEVLYEYLSSQTGFEIVGVAKNGLEAVELIKAKEPDIVLLDIIMPKMDGLGTLEKINSLNMDKKPQFIMTSAISQDKITQIALSLGAEFYLVKPFDMENLVSRIKQLCILGNQEDNISESLQIEKTDENFNEERIENKVTKFMQEAGIPSNLKGYHYLRDAIIMATDEITLLNTAPHQIYETLADRYNSMSYKVERAIRNAIEVAFSNESNSNNSLFDFLLNSEKSKPTISEFISIVAEKLR